MYKTKNLGILIANIITVVIILIFGAQIIALHVFPFGQLMLCGLIALKLLFLLADALGNSASCIIFKR